MIGTLAKKKRLRVAGLMSGTSADGIDAVIVDIDPPGKVRLLGFETFPYPPEVRRALFRLFDARTGRVDEICHLNFLLGELFAEAVIRLSRRQRVPLRSIDLVGSHGQTIHHLPQPRRAGGRRIRSTLQIGEPSVIAERTGITTVADFRPRDIAAGGQGAPLVAYVDWVLLRHPRLNRAVQNIGGIANVTYLAAGAEAEKVLAFDTGPGNMILDRLAHLASAGRLTCDRDGKLAAAGKVRQPLLRELMRHPYLRRRPPKSTGRETFGADFADRLWRRWAGRMSPADLIATLTAFTAASIGDAYRRFLPGKVDEAILCGGGARNPTLVAMLRQHLAPARVRIVDELGIDAEAKEAVAFAVLAAATIRGQAGNLPSATGARRPVVLGKIVPGRPAAPPASSRPRRT